MSEMQEAQNAPVEKVERYVPAEESASLADDAPGWSGINATGAHPEELGPVCWKCRGSGGRKSEKRPKQQRSASSEDCTVCQGKGRLPPKQQEAIALQNRPGEITRTRACPAGWKPKGPLPWVLERHERLLRDDNTSQNNNMSYNEKQAIQLLTMAEKSQKEISVHINSDDNKQSTFRRTEPLPIWLPQKGEQLCNLVGSWRILQRVASHRWTTDDLVTSYMVGRFLDSETRQKSKTIRYLDLGCGNGSVLLMTIWQILSKIDPSNKDTGSNQQPAQAKSLVATGIEARREAVQLARRSVAFNVGNKENGNPLAAVEINHGDFRSMLDSMDELKYDFVTGTPPYFRVDFTVDEGGNESTRNDGNPNRKRVRQAVINQGGMPTCKQSAPARAEFRGGVEAYCQQAARAMHKFSVFCVCENWLNNDRVYQGAKDASLVVVEVLPVQGRTGKPSPLFAVYVMRKQSYFEGISDIPETKILDCLVVRDRQGSWTQEYQTVLQSMSIPVV